MRLRALIPTTALLFGLSLACGTDHSPAPPPGGGNPVWIGTIL